MLKVLLEIGCEEIPARFMPGFLKDLKEKAEEKLRRERISFSKVETLGTYRRLVLYIEDIAAKQEDLSEEIKGPPAEIAFDKDKRPTPAAIGFARTQGVGLEDLAIRPAGNKDYVFARAVKKGKPTEKVLAALFPEIISSIYLPLAMRWGELDVKFIRPVHWIVALCGSKIVKFEYAGIKSGDRTAGHRYAKLKNKNACPSGRREKIKSAELSSYKKQLLKLGVMVDQNERKEIIRKQVEAAAKKVKATALVDKALLDEVAFLVENPIVYAGKFKEEFLSIPRDVLITSMKKNQKYFPMLDQKGKLVARFAVVTDGCRSASVVEGNQKVLSARLADAKFFFEEDKKQPLQMRTADLERVGYFEKLGNMADKSGRIGELAEWIEKRLGLDGEGQKITRRIAQLCKADLTTRMVYEFPELQGVIGREYALLSGEDPKVAQGIYEHYLPRFAEDALPNSMEGMAAALADRIDSIVGCFSIGSVPTGSEDPYGLRRAAHGIIRILAEKKIDLLLDQALEHSYKLYEPLFAKENGRKYEPFPKIKKQIVDFIASRMKPLLLEKGVRYDVVDAVLADMNDILDCFLKAKVLNKLINEAYVPGIVASADRLSRIAGRSPREEIIEADLCEKEEKELFALYMKLNWEVGEAVKGEEWEKALHALKKLTDPIECFFDKVLVMHQDERLRTNRLALLRSLDKLYLSVADFRKIVLPGQGK